MCGPRRRTRGTRARRARPGRRRDATAGEFVATYDEAQGHESGSRYPRSCTRLPPRTFWPTPTSTSSMTTAPLGRCSPGVAHPHGRDSARADGGRVSALLAEIGDTVHLVAISDAQRQTARDLDWAATVHNGLHTERMPFSDKKEDFALFLGRCSPTRASRRRSRRRGPRGHAAHGLKCHEPEEQEYFERGRFVHCWAPDVSGWARPTTEAKRDLLSSGALPGFPHPVGGAVRDGDDRGDGLRDAGRGAANGAPCRRSWSTG